MRLLACFSLFFLISCNDSYRMTTMSYENLTQSQTFTLTSKCGAQVIAIEIEGDGISKGNPVINLMLNDEEYKSLVLGSEFQFTWSGDWYSEEAIVRYKANSDSKTNLTLSYRMKCL